MAAETKIPLTFISYSHDTREHKQWVGELASKLRAQGVDVILDQWDLRPGDDVPKFMERSVRAAERVLMICTENYVRKVNEGLGGVGYEAMVVTGELVADLGTAKFIPIIRQSTKPSVLPASISTRFYIDLSDDQTIDAGFDELLRELHRVPALRKPPLGQNPFAVTSSGAELPTATESSVQGGVEATEAIETSGDIAQSRKVSIRITDAAQAYEVARGVVLTGDMGPWRSVVRAAREFALPRLAEWWNSYGGRSPGGTDSLAPESLDGVEAFTPLIAVALAAVGSGRAKFTNQIALLEEVLNPPGWHRGGLSVRVEMPYAAGFLYQAFHGAVCLHTDQLPVAIRLARESINWPNSGKSQPVWRTGALIGWPDSLGRDSRAAWNVLLGAPERWKWLLDIFGDVGDYRRALTAYYSALNLNEYADLCARGLDATKRDSEAGLRTPTHYAAQPEEIRRAAYRLLTSDPPDVCEVWRSLGVSDSTAKDNWRAWLQHCEAFHLQIYPFSNASLLRDSALIDDAVAAAAVSKSR